jgi:hypothetical protein
MMPAHPQVWLSIVDSITLRIGGAWCVAYEQGRSRIAAVSVFKILLSFLSRRFICCERKPKASCESVYLGRVVEILYYDYARLHALRLTIRRIPFSQ